MSESLNITDREGQLANRPIVEGLTDFEKYYYKNRERLLQQQRERRERLKQTPEFKEQKRIYNERYRDKSLAATYMVDYYHRNKERILEQRRRNYQRVSVEEKERRRLERCERRLAARPCQEAAVEQRRGRGRPKSIIRMDLKPNEVQLDTLLSGLVLQHFALNEPLSLTLTAKH